MSREIHQEKFNQGPDVIIPIQDHKSYRFDSIHKNKWYNNLAKVMKEGTKELQANVDGQKKVFFDQNPIFFGDDDKKRKQKLSGWKVLAKFILKDTCGTKDIGRAIQTIEDFQQY